jgi:hypothetical protein
MVLLGAHLTLENLAPEALNASRFHFNETVRKAQAIVRGEPRSNLDPLGRLVTLLPHQGVETEQMLGLEGAVPDLSGLGLGREVK